MTPELAKKTLDVSPTCANCKENHPANFSQCPSLLAFLSKKNAHSITMRPTPKPISFPPQPPNFPCLPYNKSERPYTSIRLTHGIRHGKSYVQALAPHPTPLPPQLVGQQHSPNLAENIEQIQSADLDLFLNVISLIHIPHLNCTNNIDRIKTTIQIIKELENGHS